MPHVIPRIPHWLDEFIDLVWSHRDKYTCGTTECNFVYDLYVRERFSVLRSIPPNSCEEIRRYFHIVFSDDRFRQFVFRDGIAMCLQVGSVKGDLRIGRVLQRPISLSQQPCVNYKPCPRIARHFALL